MKSLSLLCLYGATALIGAACTPADDSKRCRTDGFEHGCHEPTFSGHFRIELKLPVSEADFVTLLQERDIYHVSSTDFSDYELNKLELTNSKIARSIVIIDQRKLSSKRAEKFRAYISADNDVVLISNEFGYRAY